MYNFYRLFLPVTLQVCLHWFRKGFSVSVRLCILHRGIRVKLGPQWLRQMYMSNMIYILIVQRYPYTLHCCTYPVFFIGVWLYSGDFYFINPPYSSSLLFTRYIDVSEVLVNTRCCFILSTYIILEINKLLVGWMFIFERRRVSISNPPFLYKVYKRILPLSKNTSKLGFLSLLSRSRMNFSSPFWRSCPL